MATSPKTRTEIEKLLVTLRDAPVGTEGASDATVLAPIYDFLMNVPQSSGGGFHWFCDKADAVTLAAATFLIRLFAYSSPRVDVWKERLEKCLKGCSECVQGLVEAKFTSSSTYFGAFSDEVMKGFFASVDEWELGIVLAALSSAGFSLDASVSTRHRTLSVVPSTVVYHMVSNLFILRDSRILSVIHSCLPSDAFLGWPTDPPPAGILVLMMGKNHEIRKWARAQSSKCKMVPIPPDKFIGPYRIVIDAIAYALTSTSCASPESHRVATFASFRDNTVHGTTNAIFFASDPVDLWAGFCAVLRFIPPGWLTSSKHHDIDLRRIVTGHLHDTGSHFVDILWCHVFLLKRMGADFWQGEGPEYPQIVFDAVKDNPSYSELLLKVEPVGERQWILAWFPEYLHTMSKLAAYGEVLAKIIDFMCEELQHERFQEARPAVMVAAIRLLSSALRKSQSDDMSRHHMAVWGVLDIHADTFVTVAFSRSFNDLRWVDARNHARDLVSSALAKDIQDTSAAIIQLCKCLAGRDVNVIVLVIREPLWNKVYETMQMNDADGIAAIIAIVARSAHWDNLNKKAFSPSGQGSNVPRMSFENLDAALEGVNCSLAIIRGGFLDVLSKYANYNVSSAVLDLLRRPGVVKDIMVLMLSPIEDIQTAAQTLVGQAFDVDVRLDCFRALLENLPSAAFEGIFDFLDTFIQYAPVIPEACSLSKSLVRCLTDIIEVLCASHDGLLHNDQFLKSSEKFGPAAELPRLWNLMSKSITVIFKRTPLWSTYFENEDMIVWMRDALIFGRDMLAQRRVIETAAAIGSKQPSSLQAENPRKLSRVGKNMVNDLQDVLPELARWLRLTDEELLHQSFSLLQSLLDCFRESHIPPSPAGIAKLNRHIDDARKNDPTRPQTRLDSTRLSKLEDALASFDSDDEIQIISHTTVPEKGNYNQEQVSKKLKIKSIPPTTTVSLKSLPVDKSSKASLQIPRPSTSKLSISRFFTDRDQQKLDADVSLPSLRKPQNASPAVSSTISPTNRKDLGPKNEAVIGKVQAQEAPSSESESEDDEEPQGGGLAALGKFQRSPQMKKPAERRQIKLLDSSTHGKNAIQERLNRRDDARKTALRLKPDISGLHRALLSWNYDHGGSEPPITGVEPSLIRVPDQFPDHHQYLKVFKPLLLLECWSQIVRSKEQTPDTYQCKITSRQYTDDWVDVDISISNSVKKDWYLTETDVVLFRHLDGKRCVLGKTNSYKAMPWGIQASLRCYLHDGNTDPGLQTNTSWRLSKVFSLSTLHREYAALMALPYFDLFESVLRPRLSKIATIDPTEIRQAMITYNVNEPQAVAILSSLQTNGFALIQGPPGTGKTSTICGLVAAFLSNRPLSAAVNVGRTIVTDKWPQKKLLVCAPSNAAIDEVAHRIKDGARGFDRRVTKVVRIGADKTINISVKDISLDFLVEQKLNSDPTSNTSNDANNDIAVLRREIETVKRAKQQKLEELSGIHDNSARTLALEDEIKKLNTRRMNLTQQFDRVKDKQKSDARSLDATRRKYRAEVLQEADVICSTLSGAGHESLEQFDFEMVVIDEAAQAIELSSLIPLKYGCKRCIMVGDPQQLPPTVLSQEASKFHYDQSLFVRLQRQRPDAVHLLSIQYRMHPDISQLPSRLFYEKRLQDGPDMAIKTEQLWHSHAMFGTYRFFNVSRGQEEETNGHSLKNKAECQVAVALYNRLRQEFSTVDFDFRVGVVSMYNAQIQELRRTFQNRFGRDIVEKVDFNTVDGFQGQEKDVIILSCVRAGPGLQTVGFLSDTRRMNVALTRARSSLFILGNAPTLERSDKNWRAIVLDARTRSCLTDTDTTYFTSPTTAAPPAPPPQRRGKVQLSQAIPVDLSTPRDLKSAIDQGTSSIRPRSTLPETHQYHVSTQNIPHQPKAEKAIGAKRQMSDDVEPQPMAPNNQTPKPRIPSVKRQKQGPNLFIPKSNKPNPNKHTKDMGNTSAGLSIK